MQGGVSSACPSGPKAVLRGREGCRCHARAAMGPRGAVVEVGVGARGALGLFAGSCAMTLVNSPRSIWPSPDGSIST
eukprot:scaffold44086_cov63-Phaeocystis_antarctica.AAC.11